MEIVTEERLRAILRRDRRAAERRALVLGRVGVADGTFVYETGNVTISLTEEDGFSLKVDRNESGRTLVTPSVTFSNVDSALTYLVTFIVGNWEATKPKS